MEISFLSLAQLSLFEFIGAIIHTQEIAIKSKLVCL